MTPMTNAAISAVNTAVAAPSALQLSGGHESRNASENTPSTDAPAPQITVRTSAVIEIARSPPDIGGFARRRRCEVAGLAHAW